MPEFVEFAGKKEYKCPKCKAPIRYAKFFGPDKKLLTTDEKPPYFDKDRKPMSNTGWPTNAETKQMHECGNQPSGFATNEKVLTMDEVRDKLSKPINVSNKPLTEMDKKVRDKMIDDAYHDTEFMIWTLQGVEKACNTMKVEIGPISGMIFKEVCENIRRRNERE